MSELSQQTIIDFHVHSKYSFDCFLEPSKIIASAREKGLQGLAVTDHATMSGVAEFKRLAPDLFIIPGEEISTREGDILGLFLKEEIKPHKDGRQVAAEIRAQGGLAVLAHPFKWPHLVRDEKTLAMFDAVEIFNARNNIPVPYLENALARRAVLKSGAPYLAGSDAHELFELGRAKTTFDFSVDEAAEEKIKDAVLKRRLRVEGREVFLGHEVISHFSRNIRSFFRQA